MAPEARLQIEEQNENIKGVHIGCDILHKEYYIYNWEEKSRK